METGQKAARALALTLCVVAAGCAEHHGVHWGYEGQGKPSEWSALSPDFKACNIGTQQSPIDIRTDEAVSADIPPLTIDWTSFQPEVENNGHTIKVRTKGQGGYVSLGGKRYNLRHFHFHQLSEHTIDGEHSPMEMHFVHKSEDGDFLVIGAMLVPGAENETIAEVWSLMPETQGEQMGREPIDPKTLIPGRGEIFRYAGSLTTPPCSEIVTWYIYAEPLKVSQQQIEDFAKLYANNYRPVQATNRRVVLTAAQ
ncbi:MAG: carbonic anhydrase family protein [Hyphomicrobiales bacterium]|nr:carbonic anhydrase family protein [Hyphomicrobiales bacterium]